MSLRERLPKLALRIASGLALLVGAGLATSCPAYGVPPLTCKSDGDCAKRGPSWYCDQSLGECVWAEPAADAGDAGPVDASSDAG